MTATVTPIIGHPLGNARRVEPDVLRPGTKDAPPLVQPGKYELVYVKDQVRRLHARSLKLVVTFQIVTPGSAMGERVSRYYNLASGDPKTHRFKPGFHSRFYREYCALFGAPARRDRIPMTRFHDRVILGKVETVSRDSRQRPLAQDVCYSVVTELLEVLV